MKALIPALFFGFLAACPAFSQNATDTPTPASREAAAEQQLPWAKAQADQATAAVASLDGAKLRSRLAEAGLPEARALDFEADLAAVAANYASAGEALDSVIRNANKLKEFDELLPPAPVRSEDEADALRLEIAPLRDRLRMLETQIRLEEQSLDRARSSLEGASKDLRRAGEEADSAVEASRSRAVLLVELATAREEAASSQVFLDAWRLYADQLDRRYLTLLVAQKQNALDGSGFNSMFSPRRVEAARVKSREAVSGVSEALERARALNAELADDVPQAEPGSPANPARRLAEENAALAARTVRALEIWLGVIQKAGQLWEGVAQVVQNPDSTELLESLREEVRLLEADLVPIREQIQTTTTETARQLAEYAATPKAKEPVMRRIQQQRGEILAARDRLLRTSAVTLESVTDFTEILGAETSARLASRTLGERTVRTGVKMAGWAKSIWETELFTTEEKLISADGSSVVRHRGVALGQLVSAALGLLLGILLAGWLGRIAGARAREKFGAEPVRAASIERLVFFGIAAVALLFALHYLHIPLTAFAFLGGALAIGIGFGAQTMMSNFISGLLLTAERRIKPGDTIEVDGHRGRVLTLGTRCAYVLRVDGVEVLIPNSFLLEKTVTNWTLSDTHHRAELRVGVSYGSDPAKVIELLMEIVRQQPGILNIPEPQTFFEDFGDSALVFAVYYWVDLRVSDLRETGSRIRLAIDRVFRDAGIEIAFPQREIHLRTEEPLRVDLNPPAAGPSQSA